MPVFPLLQQQLLWVVGAGAKAGARRRGYLSPVKPEGGRVRGAEGIGKNDDADCTRTGRRRRRRRRLRRRRGSGRCAPGQQRGRRPLAALRTGGPGAGPGSCATGGIVCPACRSESQERGEAEPRAGLLRQGSLPPPASGC